MRSAKSSTSCPPPGTAPERASAIAQNLNRSAAGVTASLYALADRGLVERVPFNGWRRK